jgi:hypothetical protein
MTEFTSLRIIATFSSSSHVKRDSKTVKEIPATFPALRFGIVQRNLIGVECDRTSGLRLSS